MVLSLYFKPVMARRQMAPLPAAQASWPMHPAMIGKNDNADIDFYQLKQQARQLETTQHQSARLRSNEQRSLPRRLQRDRHATQHRTPHPQQHHRTGLA